MPTDSLPPANVAAAADRNVLRRTIFEAVADLPPHAMDQALRSACGDDVELLAELRELLQADLSLARQTLAPYAGQIIADVLGGQRAALTGVRLGPYQLLEPIGRGGMGQVYRAERVDGSVQQQVAIKFVRSDVMDLQARRRFLLERQTLATLEHPNIARLIDAAELPDGTPYFVMELVVGETIDQYCTRNALSVRACIDLLRQVFAAVSAAHRSLVVHRDLKPANILVSADGIPKLIDFGIARPLALAAAGAETGTANRAFSPAYAAPEQVLGGPIGVGCDVYALGLLMFELLAGRPAFDFEGLSAASSERLVTVVPPPLPSAVATHPERKRALRGDLDGVILRCLRKAPAERYASVEQLDADVANYLEGRPLAARRGHRWYRVRKFVQRNVALVILTTALGLAVVGGTLAIAWQAHVALQRSEELAQVTQFQSDMIAQIDVGQAGEVLSRLVQREVDSGLHRAGLTEPEITARRADFARAWEGANNADAARSFIDEVLLRPAVQAVDQRFGQQPQVAAALRQVLADQYREMVLYEAATPLQEQALQQRSALLDADHPELLASLYGKAQLLQDREDLAAAEPLLKQILARRKVFLQSAPLLLGEALDSFCLLKLDQRQLDAGSSACEEALAYWRGSVGERDPHTLTAMSNLGLLRSAQTRYEEAEKLYVRALELRQQLLGRSDPMTLRAANNLATLYMDKSRYTDALPLLRDTLGQRRELLGQNHPDTLRSISNMAFLLFQMGDPAAAEPMFEESWRRQSLVLGPDASGALISLNNLAAVQEQLDKLDVALVHRRDLLARATRALGATHGSTLIYQSLLGGLLLRMGQLEEAESLTRNALDESIRQFGADNSDVMKLEIRLGSVLIAAKRYDESLAVLQSAEPRIRKAFAGPSGRIIAKLLAEQARSKARLGQFALARADLEESWAILQAVPTPNPPTNRDCAKAWIELYTLWQEKAPDPTRAEALRHWESVLAGMTAPAPPPTPR